VCSDTTQTASPALCCAQARIVMLDMNFVAIKLDFTKAPPIVPINYVMKMTNGITMCKEILPLEWWVRHGGFGPCCRWGGVECFRCSGLERCP
jgi:hypothetical protein